MKRSLILLALMAASGTVTSCTDDSLAEAEQYEQREVIADGGEEEGHLDPPPDPPGDGS